MDYSIDYDAIIFNLKNHAANALIEKFVGEKERERTMKLIHALNKRGVSTDLFLEALMEAATEE